MRWSYPEYLCTPADVIDELDAWMQDIRAEEEKERREAEKKARQARRRR